MVESTKREIEASRQSNGSFSFQHQTSKGGHACEAWIHRFGSQKDAMTIVACPEKGGRDETLFVLGVQSAAELEEYWKESW